MTMNDPRPPFRGWIATLSDGSTAFEKAPVSGEPSSWQKFLSFIKERDLKITMLRLQRGGKTIHALPPKACSGYYQAYEFRKLVFRQTEETRQGIGSVINGQVFIVWLDDSGNVWTDVRPLEGERIHTTLRD